MGGKAWSDTAGGKACPDSGRGRAYFPVCRDECVWNGKPGGNNVRPHDNLAIGGRTRWSREMNAVQGGR